MIYAKASCLKLKILNVRRRQRNIVWLLSCVVCKPRYHPNLGSCASHCLLMYSVKKNKRLQHSDEKQNFFDILKRITVLKIKPVVSTPLGRFQCLQYFDYFLFFLMNVIKKNTKWQEKSSVRIISAQQNSKVFPSRCVGFYPTSS